MNVCFANKDMSCTITDALILMNVRQGLPRVHLINSVIIQKDRLNAEHVTKLVWDARELDVATVRSAAQDMSERAPNVWILMSAVPRRTYAQEKNKYVKTVKVDTSAYVNKDTYPKMGSV